MISHLRIQGLALIDELSIDFSQGFNVLTGETGAGKSILIRAVNFLIGAKASSENIRKGYETATVEARFLLPLRHPAGARLETIGVPLDKSGKEIEVVIRRNLNAQGRSQAWINDHSVTLSSLKSVGEVLVDVFGQHENQRLLNPRCHLDYVDRFVSDKESLKKYRLVYDEARGFLKSLTAVVQQLKHLGEDQEYAAFRLEELEKFDPTLEDFEEQKRLSEGGATLLKAKEKYDRMLSVLDGDDRSVSERLWDVQKLLQSEKLEELQAEAADLASKVDSLHYEISKRAGSVDVDEDQIESAQQRVFGYQNLFRKHHVRDIDSLLTAVEAIRLSAASAEQLEEQLGAVLKKLEKTASELQTLNLKLSKARLAASNEMKKSIENELRELSMPGARFSVSWTEHDENRTEISENDLPEGLRPRWAKIQEVWSPLSVQGGQDCEFMLGANAGEELYPLSRVASGGELSRTMLALKKAISVDAETCVLVFDEIDTGISGRVADVVGSKLRELSRDFQVICISHLPQVAVYADSHFLVEKGNAKGKEVRTSTRITRLSTSESEREIARLLSGDAVTKISLENAKALIARTKNKQKKQTKGNNDKTSRGTSLSHS